MTVLVSNIVLGGGEEKLPDSVIPILLILFSNSVHYSNPNSVNIFLQQYFYIFIAEKIIIYKF